ncbi:MAG: TIGR04053 family radical SAM/SPASM domain-containing protein [Desulfurococcales archaeon]|nr:TIGR04053 family radical SAM/SPASM domain-containing protein [Desulfurococcales archaeon]
MRTWPYDLKPLLVFWESTKACLLECIHCRAEAIKEPLPGELTTDQAIRLIEDVAGFGRPSPIMVFTGGDLLMRSDIWRLLEHARKLGVRTAVAPSVTPLLATEAMDRFVELGVGGVSISIDSPYPEVHDKIRGIEGTWDRSIWALRELLKRPLRVQVNTVVMRSTVEGLADMVKLLVDLGVPTWEVFYLIPVGRAGFAEDLTPGEWEDVGLFLYQASKYGVRVRTTEGPMFRRIALTASRLEERGESIEDLARPGPLYKRLMDRLVSLLGKPRGPPQAHTVGTMDGRGIVFISYNGTVYPSGFLPLPAGNVKVRSLREIYRETTLFRKLRSNLKGRCGRCEFRDICGGSRARAFAYTGNPLEEDPACPYEPGSWGVAI